MKNFLATILLLYFPLLCFSQDGESSKTVRPKFKHKSKVESIFDKQKNQTTTYLRPMILFQKRSSIDATIMNDGKRTAFLPAETIWITAYVVSPGKTPVKPESVVIAFRTETLDKTKFDSDRSLSLTLDGQVMDLGDMTLMERKVADNMQVPNHQYMRESLEVSVSHEGFVKITGAKKAKVRLAGEEFDLTNDHLEAFRDLFSNVSAN